MYTPPAPIILSVIVWLTEPIVCVGDNPPLPLTLPFHNLSFPSFLYSPHSHPSFSPCLITPILFTISVVPFLILTFGTTSQFPPFFLSIFLSCHFLSLFCFFLLLGKIFPFLLFLCLMCSSVHLLLSFLGLIQISLSLSISF